MSKLFRLRRNNGTAVAEMPGAIWLFLVGMLFPLIALVTISYRVILLNNGVRDCCYQAALAQSFTEAQTKAASTLATDAAAFSGISIAGGDPRVRIVVRELATGKETEYSAPLPVGSIQTQNFNYFIRVYVDATVDPLINMGTTGFWTNIPGLTGPIQLKNMVYDSFAENPDGLES